MRCPYCGGDLEVESIYEENRYDIINGCIKCKCNRYPILNSILCLKVDSLKEPAIKLLDQGDARRAIALFLLSQARFFYTLSNFLKSKGPYGEIASKIIVSFIGLFACRVLSEYEDTCISYYKLQHDSFLKHRFSVQTIWSVYPFFSLLKRKRGRLLNLCCGNGHLSFMISKCVSPEEQICLDHDFCSLYLARKYFVPDATFICFDVNYPLPFKEKVFSSIICSDAFPFIIGRALLASEQDRVLQPDGIVLVSHLRNSLYSNSCIGSNILKLPPITWGSFFYNNFKIKLLPEQKLVDDFFRGTLDLLSECSEQTLDSSDPIAIMASRDDSIFTVHEGINKDFLANMDNLIINPIYRVKFEGNKATLEKHNIGDYFLKLYPLTKSRLPDRYTLNAEILLPKTRRITLKGDLSEDRMKYIIDLMGRLIIINVPLKYISDDDLQSA